jgi:hypothetical protein
VRVTGFDEGANPVEFHIFQWHDFVNVAGGLPKSGWLKRNIPPRSWRTKMIHISEVGSTGAGYKILKTAKESFNER